MVINTNISAQNAASQLMQSSSALSTSLQRLSSGSTITSPADDPAGLAVSMQFTSEIGRVNAASNNVSDATSFSQTQDGYLQQVNTAFSRMSELAVEAQDVTKTTSDRALYQQEYSALGNYINNVSTQSFNGVSLFDGSTLNVTTDPNGDTFSMVGINLSNTTYTTATGDDITSISGAQTAVTDTENAINQLASDRANIGANEESLSYYSNQLEALNNNLSAANSQIADVDVATESTTYAKENILVQTGTAMLAQANQLPQSVLKLLS
ncbi:MAG TPA: flagellin [Candidatus Sulfotelmatobacter sp.]|jgi:flagellin|nr:flagellin [Candidatus Sulfotelmatobacter sp.]